jgi:molybdate transport system permease protein
MTHHNSLKWLNKNAWKLSMAPLLLLIGVPIIALVLNISPLDFWMQIQQEEVHQAVQISFASSFCTVLLTLLMGTPLAYYLSHRRYRLHRLVDTLVDLPTVLPPAVAGVALLLAFGRRGLLGGWFSLLGLTIPFSFAAVVLAQLFIAAPFYVKSAALGFAAVDFELKKAAALDGANRWQTFRHIIVPMSWAPILSGCVMTWARALGEFGATIIFAGNFPGRTQTMPLAIYIGYEINMTTALTLSIILVVISFVVLVLVKTLLQDHLPFIEDES